MFKRLKEILKIIKELKGCKSMVALRCSHCNSLDIELIPNTYVTNTLSDSTIKEEYGIKCNKCNSVALINEFWLEDSEIDIKKEKKEDKEQ